MATPGTENQPAELTAADVYYALFRHKWIVLICTAVGVAGSIAIYFMTPTVYRSAAKILVRYIPDSSVITPVSPGGRVISPDRYGQNVINSEVEILSSRSLIERTVDRIGKESHGHDPAF